MDPNAPPGEQRKSLEEVLAARPVSTGELLGKPLLIAIVVFGLIAMSILALASDARCDAMARRGETRPWACVLFTDGVP